MKRHTLTAAIGITSGFTFVCSALADTVINDFDFFTPNALYASWAAATIDSGPTAWTVTASGYGSNWKYNPVDATGETTVQVTLTLSGGGDGFLGPIVSLEDADGTSYNFAWYGQSLGHHVLTKPLSSPTWVGAAGSIAGFDPSTLTHLHMQLDSSTYAGSYTVSWEDLRLIGAPPPIITSPSYNPDTHEFTLTWTSKSGKSYTILQSPDLSTPFAPLVTDVLAFGASTTTTVTMPAGNAGFLKIQEQ